MNEAAIQRAYELFTLDGYNKSLEDFTSLIHKNPNAFKRSYDLFREDGYIHNTSRFAKLMGVSEDTPEFLPVFRGDRPVKKKVSTDTESGLGDGSLVQPEVNVGLEEEVIEIGEPVSPSPSQLSQRLGFGSNDSNEAPVSDDLSSTINAVITPEFLGQNEDDAIKTLQDNFSQYGFVFDGSAPGMDRITVRSADGAHSTTIGFNTSHLISGDEIKQQNINKLSQFLNTYYKSPMAPKEEDAISKALRANESRTAARVNDDGSRSSHLMTSYEEDGVFKVVPTLFPVDPDSQSNNPNQWIEAKNLSDAIAIAESRGEVSEFATEAEAEAFAKGAWKHINTLDLEADRFFKERGLDYATIKKARERYDEISEMVDIHRGGVDEKLKALKEEDAAFGTTDYWMAKIATSFGMFDSEEIDALQQEQEELYSVLSDGPFGDGYVRTALEDYDLYLAKRQRVVQGNSVQQSKEVTANIQLLREESVKRFGVSPEELNNLEIPEERYEEAKFISTQYQIQQDKLRIALAAYERSATYFDEKTNKAITEDFTENMESFTTSISQGNKEGNAGVILGQWVMGEFDDTASLEEASRKIAILKSQGSGAMSRVFASSNNSKTAAEWFDVVSNDPAEWMSSLAAKSMSQMLPLGAMIVKNPALLSVPLSYGATKGGQVLGSTGNPLAALLATGAGFVEGMFMASGFAMEYTSSIFEVAGEMGYNMNDEDDVFKALQDPDVWDKGSERGVKRGIPITIANFIGIRLAGNVVPVTALSSTGRRIGAAVTEGLVIDPSVEATGELVAQLNAGQDISWAEIGAEAGGAPFSNAAFSGTNSLLRSVVNTNDKLAKNLSNLGYLNNLSATDEKVTNWATKMRKLGKITAEQEESILNNVSARREAQQVMDAQKKMTGTSMSRAQSSQIRGRLMQLMAMRNLIESLPTKVAEIYSQVSRGITDEMREITETGKLSANPIELSESISKREDETGTFIWDSKEVTREEFLEKLEAVTDEELRDMKDRGSYIIPYNAPVTAGLVANRLKGVFQETSTDKEPAAIDFSKKQTFVSGITDAIKKGNPFAHITAENPGNETMSPEENAQRNAELKVDLEAMGYNPIEIDGKYDRDEKSFFVEGITEADAITLGKKYGQESVAHSAGMLYITGKNAGKKNPTTGDVVVNDSLDNMYSVMPTEEGNVKYQIGYNWESFEDIETTTDQDDAIQESSPESVDAQESPADSQKVGDRVPDPRTTTEEVTTEDQASDQATETSPTEGRVEPIRKIVAADKAAYEDGQLSDERLDGFLAHIAEKEESGKKLTPFQVKLKSQNEDRFEEIAAQRYAASQETESKSEAEILEKLLKGVDVSRSQIGLNPEQKTRNKVIIDQAIAAMKAIQDVLPGVTIRLFETKEGFAKFTGDGTVAGDFTDSQISINLELADETTLGHEIFHAIMLKGIGDAESQALADEMLSAVLKTLGKGSKLAEKLNAFASAYPKWVQNEERLAQLFGILAAHQGELTPPARNAIVEFFRKLAKLVGLGAYLKVDANDVIVLINLLAGKVSEGQVITAEDLSKLNRLKSKAATKIKAAANSRRQVEDNLLNRSQKFVQDFDELERLNNEGVMFHFGSNDILDVMPEKLKRMVSGYGIYFVDKAESPTTYSVYATSYGRRVTLVDGSDMNLVDSGSKISNEEFTTLRDAFNKEVSALDEVSPEITELSEYLNEFDLDLQGANPTWSEMLTVMSPDLLSSDTDFFLGGVIDKPHSYSDIQKQFIAEVTAKALGYDGATSKIGKGSINEHSVVNVWNFDKVNKNIISDEAFTPRMQVVTEEDGKPVTFYHGTDKKFDKFEPQKSTRTILLSQYEVNTPAIFFTPDEAEAREYGDNVIPVNLQFEKLVEDNIDEAAKIITDYYVKEKDGVIEVQDGVVDLSDYYDEATDSYSNNWVKYVLDESEGIDWMLLDEEALVEKFKEAGFDGTKVYEGDNAFSVATFYPENIVRLDQGVAPRQQGVVSRQQVEGIDPKDVRMRSRSGNRVGKGLGVRKVNNEPVVEEIPDLTLDYVRENAPASYLKNANLIAQYPLVRGIKNFDEVSTLEQADEVYEVYARQVADNLNWIMENYPEEYREISTLWYDGANKIANELAEEYGVSPEQVAGIIASLSPQNDWYQNVRAAELLLLAFRENPVMSQEMIDYQVNYTDRQIKSLKNRIKSARKERGKSRAKAKVEKFKAVEAQNLKSISEAEDVLDLLRSHKGKRMEDAPDALKPYYVRLYSEINQPKSYPIISPDGNYGSDVLTYGGSKRKFGWGPYAEIGKGVSIRLDGSQENISVTLGQMHKIRNFFNNIIDPMSKEKDITMDTHAIAAALLIPASSSTEEVLQNFGTGTANAAPKGQKGLYYANQEGYFLSAEENNMLPRQVQSATWEAVRGLFTSKFKGAAKNVKSINDIWENYAEGNITIEQARQEVLEKADGINAPSWAGLISDESRDGDGTTTERRRGKRGGPATEREGVAPRQQLVYHVTFSKNEAGIKKNGLMKGRPGTFSRQTGGKFDTAKKTFAFLDLDDAMVWAQKTNLDFGKPVSIVVVKKGDKVFKKDDQVFFLDSAVFTEDAIEKEDISLVQNLNAASFMFYQPKKKPGVAPRQQVERDIRNQPGITSIIETGRNANLSEEAIRRVLVARNFPKEVIDEALLLPIDMFTTMPAAFDKVEGGVQESLELFKEVTSAVQKAARPRKVRDKNEYKTLSRGELREKALEALRGSKIFQRQPEQLKMELELSVDGMMNIRSNQVIQKQISEIRNSLKQRKLAKKDVAEAQRRLKNFIKENLRGLPDLKVSAVNKLLAAIDRASTPEEFTAQAIKVLDVAEKRIAQQKVDIKKEIRGIIRNKSKARVLPSGKRRAGSVDADTRNFFEAALFILNEIQEKGTEMVSSELQNNALYEEAINKEINGEKLTAKERLVINKMIALDALGDIDNMSVADLMVLKDELKALRSEGIAILKANRLERSERYKAMSVEAEKQIRKLNPYLYNKDGSVKNDNELREDRENIQRDIRKGKLGAAIRKLWETLAVRAPKQIMKLAGSYLANVQTLTTLLDNSAKGFSFFTDNIYRPLTRMDEDHTRGVFTQTEVLDGIANTIEGISNGYKGITERLFMGEVTIRSRGGKDKITNGNQLLRIYALSLNPIQREKLKASGYGAYELKQVEEALGPELMEFADKVVDYLSNQYFEGLSQVYSMMNDVSLGYVDNYFPTRSIIDAAPAPINLKEGQFTGFGNDLNADSSPHLKGRTDTSRPVDTHALFTDVLSNYFDSMERYKAYAQGARDISKIFANPAVNALLSRHTTGLRDALLTQVARAISPNSVDQVKYQEGYVDTAMRTLYGLALHFRPIQMAAQASSFVVAFQDYKSNAKINKALTYIPGGHLVSFMIDVGEVLVSLPASALGIGNFKNPITEAKEVSATFRKRVIKNMAGDIFGLESGLRTSQTTSTKGGVARKLRRLGKGYQIAGGFFTGAGDIGGVMGYMAVYRRDLKNGMSKAEALERFNEYNSTQQTRRNVDKSPIQASQDQLTKTFTVFGSVFFLQYNRVIQTSTDIMKSVTNTDVPLLQRKPKAKDVRGFLLAYALANAFYQFIKHIFVFKEGDDEDIEGAMKLIEDAALGLPLIYNVPIFGVGVEFSVSTIRGDRFFGTTTTNPVLSVIQDISRNLKDGEIEDYLKVAAEITTRSNIDPLIGLVNIGDDLTQGNEVDDEFIYDAIGLAKSQRPSE